MTDQKILVLRKQQKNAVKLNINKELEKSSQFLETDADASSDKIEITINKLTVYDNKLRELDEQILPNCEENEITEEVAKSNDLQDNILEITQQLQMLLRKREKDNIPATAESISGVTNRNTLGSVKLPKLEIANFNGDPLQWQEFWDNFENTIHSNDSLAEVDKFKYLKSFIKGDVLRLVEGYRLTAANYSAVIEILKDRYGNPQLAVFSHFEKMLALQPANHEYDELQRVFDECERHIRSLVALGLPEDTFGQVFTPIVLSKLPKFVRMELHRRNGSALWTLAKLRELLRDEIRARGLSQDTIAQASGTGSSNRVPQSSGFTSPFRQSISPRKSAVSTSSSLITSSSLKNSSCTYCNGAHYSDQCTKFPDVGSRRRMLKGRCLLCLGEGHIVRDCRTNRQCQHCNKFGHHRSLCISKFGGSKGVSQAQDSSLPVGESEEPPEITVPVKDTNLLSHGERTILQTAIARSVGRQQRDARLLLDTGCSRSFVTTQLCQDIGAEYKGEEVTSIAGFSQSKRKTVTYKIYEFDIVLTDGKKKRITANATDVITCPVQKIPLNLEKYPFIKTLQLAEPLVTETKMVEIDILIGGDYYYDLVQMERIHCSDGLVFLSSSLGYVAAGRIEVKDSTKNDVTSLLLTKTNSIPEVNFDVERFWKLEDIGIKDKPDVSDDEIALETFNNTIAFEDGRYHVKWPWKQNAPELAENYGLSRARLRGLWKRLSEQPEVLDKYNATIEEQIDKGIVELAPNNTADSPVYYMPHHCVITPKKSTTKLRIVYDASSKERKTDYSLNECIYRGPLLLTNLVGLLLRFRLGKIAIVSDIEKAFLQIALHKPDRDATRFLWVKDVRRPPTDENIVVFRFRRVPFGVNASPFLLAGTIAHHLEKIATKTAHDIRDNVYVDNIIAGKETIGEALDYYKEAKDIFNKCSMNLREWYCNDNDVMKEIENPDRGEERETKVLGLLWNVQSDSLRCSVPKFDEFSVTTKRQLLKIIASIFDPCGYFSPVTIRAKMLMQEIWKEKHPWDNLLPETVLKQATVILAELRKIENKSITRSYGSDLLNASNEYELHCFCDASAKAYSAVVYLRIRKKSDVQSFLVFAKSRVAPLKLITIPKLELLAITIGSRAISFVESQMPFTISKRWIWTDSKCSLHWILGKEVTSTFVRNRVREIKSKPGLQFRYVPTDENPADLPTRGIKCDDLDQLTIWWNGPVWLQMNADWPVYTETEFTASKSTEKDWNSSKTTQLAVETVEKTSMQYVTEVERYSSLLKLLRVTSWIRRFVNNTRKVNVIEGDLKYSEIKDSQLFWEKCVQRMFLSDIMNDSEKVTQLGLFLDQDGIVRCRGRFEHSSLPETAKTPILLPCKDNAFTNLIILDCHIRLCHAGVAHTLSRLRNRYWVIKGRCEVKRVLKRCHHCRRVFGGSFPIPEEAPLPDFRCTQDDVFSRIGLDYFGPLYVSSGEDCTQKVWICLFTCAIVRAVHLEVVEDLTTQQFILCLRRFAAIYGVPKLIVSDNAKQFHLARKVIDKVFQDILESQEVADFSLTEGIQWKFITELAPWMGGFYERMVGVVKQSLKRCLGAKLLRLIELQTIATEISAVVNSRPLVYLDEDIGQNVLTPAHFLFRHRQCFPRLSETASSFEPRQTSTLQLVHYWKRIQHILDHFWKMWSNQYLLSLREHWRKIKQRHVSDIEPSVGTTVLIKDSLSRIHWKLGLIVELFRSHDGLCRSAKVRLPNGRFVNRSLKQLYPIETSVTDRDKENSTNTVAKTRPCRTAANVARQNIKLQLEDEQENTF